MVGLGRVLPTVLADEFGGVDVVSGDRLIAPDGLHEHVDLHVGRYVEQRCLRRPQKANPGHTMVLEGSKCLTVAGGGRCVCRTVRRRAARPREPLRAVGIDDWAWRKGCQYGTIICDLERRRIVALLPDRAGGTSAAWLRDHPSIEFIARDRGASYGDAASKGAPQAVQIADRWHLFENASASFLDVVRQNMHAIRKSSATDDIDPALLSCAERKRWENFQHRKKTVDAVLRLLEQGTPLKQITRRLNLAR